MKEPSVGISTRADALDDRVPREEWILGRNPTIRRIAQHAERAAKVGCTVLVTGETGTGKEVWARCIHQLGRDSSRPFVPVNCAALTATLAESQLFGHEKGAFTGALGAALGVFRAARGGVVFLDEVGEMPLELQPKLLRVLQESEVTPVGSAIPVPVDVQIVAATNRNLGEDVAKGNFREDLYFRLNMVELNVPPLRDRIEDVPLLAEHFLRLYAEEYRKEPRALSGETMNVMMGYNWPGNVRELENMIKRMVVLGSEQAVLKEIQRQDLDLTPSPASSEEDLDLASLGADLSQPGGLDLKAISKRAARVAEKKVIERVLAQTRWNRKEAALRLQIGHKALLYKMKENGLSDGG